MNSTVVMSSSTAVDLALLGLLAERARSLDELVGGVKVMGGDRFTPTSAFIAGRVADLIATGCVERQPDSDRVGATRAGTAHLARLLCLEIDPGAAALWAFCTTLKLSLLHQVRAECRRAVVATLLGAGRRRASALEMTQWTLRWPRDGALPGARAGARGARAALAAGCHGGREDGGGR
jgi:Putative AphA-like transcriptional regulator